MEAFVRPHLDYGNILYNQTYNNSFHEKLGSIQYNACLVLTGAISSFSTEKKYKEIHFESLWVCGWYRKLLYKVLNNEHPQHLFNLIPGRGKLYSVRNAQHLVYLVLIEIIIFLKNSFFPPTITDWNKLDPGLRKAESLLLFKNNVLKIIQSFLNCLQLP